MTDKKTYRVIVSDRAKRMLGTHIRFLAQVNPQAATAKKKELLSAMRSLSQMPHRFPFFQEAYIPPNKYHKMFIQNWYLILYQIRDDTVYIDYILDCLYGDNVFEKCGINRDGAGEVGKPRYFNGKRHF